MSKIETVGIKAFSSAVSAYLGKVSLGVRVFISDRGKVIAELHSPGEAPSITSDLHPSLVDLQKRGLLRVGSGKQVKFPRGEPLIKDLNIGDLIDQLRGE